MGNKASKDHDVKIHNTPVEFQTYLMIVQTKINLNRNKKVELIKRKRKEAADCLLENNLDLAKVKMDSVIREEDLITVYDILGPICEILKEKVSCLLIFEKCPDDLRASLDTLIYASTRLEIEELHKIRELIRKKYGEIYISKANANVDGLVNLNVVDKLKIRQTADPYLIARLKQICRDEGIKYDFPQDVIPFVTHPESFNNYVNQYSSIGGKIQGNMPMIYNPNLFPGINNINMNLPPDENTDFNKPVNFQYNYKNESIPYIGQRNVNSNCGGRSGLNQNNFPTNIPANFQTNPSLTYFQDFNNRNVNVNGTQINTEYKYKDPGFEYKPPTGKFVEGGDSNLGINEHPGIENLSNIKEVTPNLKSDSKEDKNKGDVKMENLQEEKLEFPGRQNEKTNPQLDSRIKQDFNKHDNIQQNIQNLNDDYRFQNFNMLFPRKEDKSNPNVFQDSDFHLPTRSVVLTSLKQNDLKIDIPKADNDKKSKEEEFGSIYLKSPKDENYSELKIFDINHPPIENMNEYNLIGDKYKTINRENEFNLSNENFEINKNLEVNTFSKSAGNKLYSNDKSSTPRPLDEITDMNKKDVSKSLNLDPKEINQQFLNENINEKQGAIMNENPEFPPSILNKEIKKQENALDGNPARSVDFNVNIENLFPQVTRTLSSEFPKPKLDD